MNQKKPGVDRDPRKKESGMSPSKGKKKKGRKGGGY